MRSFSKNSGVLLLTSFIVLGIGGDPFQDMSESGKCSGTNTCSVHNIRCASNQLIAIHAAFYGFTLRDDYYDIWCAREPCETEQLCCRKGQRKFCTVAFSDAHLLDLAVACAGAMSCAAESQRGHNFNECFSATTDLYNRYSTSSFVRYSCVEGKNFFNTHDNRTAVKVDRASLWLNGSTFDARRPHTAHCTIETASRSEASITMYSMSVLSRASADWSVRVLSRNSLYTFNPAWFQQGATPSALTRRVATILTPVSLNISIERDNYPQLFWLWFEGESNKFTMECTTPDETPTLAPTTTKRMPTTTKRPNITVITMVTTTTSLNNITIRPPTLPVTNTTPENTTDGLVKNETEQSGLQSSQDGEDKSKALIIAGSVVAAITVVAATVTVSFLLYRRWNRKRKAEETRRLNTLPSRSTLDGDGYCVPCVTPASGVSLMVVNPGYISDGKVRKPGSAGGKIRVKGHEHGNINEGKSSSLNRSENCDSEFGDVGRLYEDLDGENEDRESGIDENSFDSEFEDYEPSLYSEPHAASRGVENTDVGARGNESQDCPAVADTVYFELEPEYHNLQTTIHATGMETPQAAGGLPPTSSSSTQHLITSESSLSLQPASDTFAGAPDYPLPSEPSTGHILDKVKQGARNVRTKIQGLIPKREKFTPAKKGGLQVSDISVVLPSSQEQHVPATFSPTASTPYNGDKTGRLSSSSVYAQRRLPVVPHQTGRGHEVSATNMGADDSLYLKAEPIELSGDAHETTFSFQPSVQKPSHQVRVKSGAAPDTRNRANYENQMPSGVIAEIQKRSNFRKPSSNEGCKFTVAASDRDDHPSDQKSRDVGQNTRERRQVKDAYTEVCKKKKPSPADSKPVESGPQRVSIQEEEDSSYNPYDAPYNKTSTSASSANTRNPRYDHVTLQDDVFAEDGARVYYNLDDDLTGGQEEC
ncbi:hypothetical protein BaRGS_00005522 [Batillaria attramentaria]|uniref:Uncharacterized protein n=1 Tax=Batillaria attramentaria TaxID=370345 RepID=A0ABD0LV77_9CAEN